MSKFKVGDKVKIKSLPELFDKKYSKRVYKITECGDKLFRLDDTWIYSHRDLVLYIPDNAINRALYPELKPEEGILV
jgi:hypothetical protein